MMVLIRKERALRHRPGVFVDQVKALKGKPNGGMDLDVSTEQLLPWGEMFPPISVAIV
jgi:hypothetical protein